MTTLSRRAALTVLGGIGMMLASIPASAQDYPRKPIRLVVGFAPGGNTDLVARLIAPIISKELGQQVIVENKPGANGNVAMASVVNAAPDGYTVLFSSASQIVFSPNTYKTMPADPINGLAHISMVAEGDFIFVTNAQTGTKTVKDFIELAKSKPGKLNLAASGAGGGIHVLLESFKTAAQLDMPAVQYRGTGPLMPDLLSNQVQLFADGLPAVEAHVRAGTLIPLLVTAKQRLDVFPDVPTADEIGMQELSSMTNWFGLHVPKDTSLPIVDKLYAAIQAAKKNEELVARLKTAGMVAVASSPNEFRARIEEANKLIGAVARRARIEVE